MHEIVAAIKKMNRWRSGGEAQIPAEYFKAILTVADDTKSIREWNALMRSIMAIFDEVWTSGSYPGEEDIPKPVHIRTAAEALDNRNYGPLFRPDEEEWKFEYQQLNPKSGESEGRYAAYKSATNHNQFIALGTAHMVSNGRLQRDSKSKLHSDIKFDIEHGYLKVIDPRLTPEIVAELDDGADDTGICYPEWVKVKLVLLPKKGKPWTTEELARHMSSEYCVKDPVVRAGRAAERRHGGERTRESVWISFSERDHRWYFQSPHGIAKATGA